MTIVLLSVSRRDSRKLAGFFGSDSISLYARGSVDCFSKEIANLFSNIQMEEKLVCKAETHKRRNPFEAAYSSVLITQTELVFKPGDR